MEITNLQLFAIAVICLVVIIYYIWRSESVQRAEFDAKMRDQDAKQAAEDERWHRRMLHEADSYNESASMEPFCGEGKKP